MDRIISLVLITIIIAVVPFISTAQSSEDNLIQMAILLDTSNSMDGLIDQAKSQLWKIVNELAVSKKNGVSPKLEVALFEYGNNSIDSSAGYVRLVAVLTTDLDKISEELFNLTTNGGNEYCGYVIKDALNKLLWNKNNNVYKVIFIAGNEPFTQGNVDYKKSCKNAISKGVIVNTIFCGDMEEGIETKWKDGADLADGKYININQDYVEEYIAAPQDDVLVKLNEELNKTYLAYGAMGEEKKEMQTRQDSNAASMSKESAIQRVITKSKKQYSNASWDLLDAYKEGEIDISKMDNEELPAEMKNMNEKEKEEYLGKKLKERKEIQEKINKLNDERKKYIDKVKKENAEDNSLDSAIIKSIREQATKKNFKF